MISRVPATERLRLRALTGSDLPLFRALYCDADTMRHIGRPMSPADARASLRATLNAAREPQGPWFFVIVERRSHRALGLCSVRLASAQAERAEAGIMLLRTAHGHGYAREALTALIDGAFKALPITAVSVQYRRANARSARLFDGLGFPKPRPGAQSGRCIRILRRTQWRQCPPPSMRGSEMPNIIGFLEQTGGNAALRHASREQLLQSMRDGNIELTLQEALLQPQRAVLDALLSVRETMYCINQAIAPPKKKAPAKKKPAKAPPKKAPAKKPAKKAPAKRKR